VASNPSVDSDSAKPMGADDLKLIHGVGPGIEKCLHRAGILTFEQLAALSPEEIAPLVSDISGRTVERITGEDWVGQARQFATSRAEADVPNDAGTPDDGQHYASFTLQLLLDEANEVRRTRITHVQGGESGTWPGWDLAHLRDFVVQHAELRIATSEPATPPDSEPVSETTVPQPSSPSKPVAQLSGDVHMREFTVWPSGGDRPRNLIPHDQPFYAQAALDLVDVSAPSGMMLDYAATIYARSLSGRGRHLVGEARGSVTMPAQEVMLHIDGTGLAEDVYRLQAEATVDLPVPDALASPGRACSHDGPILAVY
jgi:hypothetical protein